MGNSDGCFVTQKAQVTSWACGGCPTTGNRMFCMAEPFPVGSYTLQGDGVGIELVVGHPGGVMENRLMCGERPHIG